MREEKDMAAGIGNRQKAELFAFFSPRFTTRGLNHPPSLFSPPPFAIVLLDVEISLCRSYFQDVRSLIGEAVVAAGAAAGI